MWLRISEDVYLPAGELVGFFAPDAVCGDEAASDKPMAVALMRDGRALAMPFGLKSLVGRYGRAGFGNTTEHTGE